MSAPQFTPGPWLADPVVPNAKRAFYIVGNLDGNNATVDIGTVGPTLSPRAEANARLIAAAPELYEALDALVGFARNNATVGQAYVDDAEAALAKARGDA